MQRSSMMQALEHRDADLLEGQGFPERLARVGDDAGAEGEAGHVVFGDAAREQVELQAGDGVAGVGAAVDLEDGADDVATAREGLQFADDLRDEASLAFVSHADADVGDEVALKGGECHVQERRGGRARPSASEERRRVGLGRGALLAFVEVV